MEKLKVGICGWGNVATGLFNALGNNADIIASNAGVQFTISVIGARRDNPKCDPGNTPIERDIFDVINHDIDVVIELIGGVEVARELIVKAIKKSNLGINPQTEGQLIRLPIPKLSEERRNEIVKVASEFAENSKVTIRNIRRDFIDISKNEKKTSNLSEDELKRKINEIQKITDNNIEKIDKILETKKIDILKV